MEKETLTLMAESSSVHMTPRCFLSIGLSTSRRSTSAQRGFHKCAAREICRARRRSHLHKLTLLFIAAVVASLALGSYAVDEATIWADGGGVRSPPAADAGYQ